ncbi:PREDICTED: vasoactive intestinal polypeptide receptor 1 [Hipposideros armiger]|uniref:Vasoactive intestinal polypeptide receptor 1 n=1 Tax=Hipposideros armiger TaxID=186990 RepID=A0A8B7QCS1_HIPAR|nr:PREDICTED: vasoactive intestinal polypeptide receptor 1 [Hipposideros armiger]
MIEADRKQCLEDAPLENETAGCSKMWDNLTCWPATPRGQVVILACPFDLSPIQDRNVSRSCTDEGWTQLEPGPYPDACGFDDKESGLDEQQLKMYYSSVKTGYTIGYSLSLATLLVAMAILSLFSLVPHKMALHLGTGYQRVGCKAAMVLFQYCVMANFFWLLVEGLYLHTLLAASFSERKYFWGYILIGWGLPSIFIMVWIITRIYVEDRGCWDVINSSLLWWILKAPILTSILVRPPPTARDEETEAQTGKLAKSTLLLIPLFGIHYTVFAFFPINFKADVKIVFELVVGSFQGFVVAILYCFLNGEVQAELRRKWRRSNLKGILGRGSKYQYSSGGSNGVTCSTQVSMLTRGSPSGRRSSSFQAEDFLV